MANNGNNMHFVRYSHKTADNGVEEYLYKKELAKEQKIARSEYEELNKKDIPCQRKCI